MNMPLHNQQTNYKPTTFHQDTPKALREVIEARHGRDRRVRIWYGNAKPGLPTTGEVWHEEYDVTGYIGRSTGKSPIPILVHNRSSLGGTAILDHCILRIDETATGRTLYKHSLYKRPIYEMHMADNAKLPYAVYVAKQVADDADQVELTPIAAFATPGRAKRWMDFMIGKRYNK